MVGDENISDSGIENDLSKSNLRGAGDVSTPSTPATEIRDIQVIDCQEIEEEKEDSDSSDSPDTCEYEHDEIRIRHRLVRCDKPIWHRVFDRSEYDRLRAIKQRIESILREGKLFSMVGPSPPIRTALLARGWLEKTGNKIGISSNGKTADEAFLKYLQSASSGKRSERLLRQRILQTVRPNFIWTWTDIDWSTITNYQKVSKLVNPDFANKDGLSHILQSTNWNYPETKHEVLFPRCYDLFHRSEIVAFKADFQITSCISFLALLMKIVNENSLEVVESPDGSISWEYVEFALERCREYVASRTHWDVYYTIREASPIKWSMFLKNFYNFRTGRHRFIKSTKYDPEHLYQACVDMMEVLACHWPQLKIDGYMNIWILKPSRGSRGRGIEIKDTLEEILDRLTVYNMEKNKYVVQKYIESPFLICNTKFDIRQWFIVTSVYPLVIWMARESYLRFTSQDYNLENYHESIHLCNFAVQQNYPNPLDRNPQLPEEKMWDSVTFQNYLTKIGHPNAWWDKVYPNMKANIIGTVLASQEFLEPRENSFELFGADFILTPDLNTWLIEINSNPSMNYSTSITARLCPQVLEDVVKVVVDYPENNLTNTGMFECIYSQYFPKRSVRMRCPLHVNGHAMKLCCPDGDTVEHHETNCYAVDFDFKTVSTQTDYSLFRYLPRHTSGPEPTEAKKEHEAPKKKKKKKRPWYQGTSAPDPARKENAATQVKGKRRRNVK